MKTRSIIIADWQSRALSDGRLSQVRVPCKNTSSTFMTRYGIPNTPISRNTEVDVYSCSAQYMHAYIKRYCPFGQPGDRLWCRETWACGTHMGQLTVSPKKLGDDMWVAWKGDYREDAPALKEIAWSSPVTMPRWASRWTLEVVRVWVERLWEMSVNNAVATGCLPITPGQLTAASVDPHLYGHRIVWNKRYAKKGLAYITNPWTWVAEVELIEREKS